VLTKQFLTSALSEDAPHQGSWDSIHIFEARERGRQARYSLTSTILLWLNTKPAEGEAAKDVSLSGSMTRQVCSRQPSPSCRGEPRADSQTTQIEQDYALANPAAHIVNVGKLVEDMEWV
jgi:capping protein beta